MNCPHCNVTLTVTHRQGVEIDHCPQCRGVWLDRGELDKIIERYDAYAPDDARRHTAPPDYREYGGDFGDRHPPGAHHHRRKSFWQELFD